MNYEKFFKEHYGQIRTFIYNMVLDWHVACDLTQETFLKFFNVDKTGKVMNGSINYLYQCARNRVIDYGRYKTRYYEFYNTYAEFLACIPEEEQTVDLETEVTNKMLADTLYTEISNIPGTQCREVMKRVFVYNQDNKQISKELGLTQRTVINHKFIGLEKLRAKFGN